MPGQRKGDRHVVVVGAMGDQQRILVEAPVVKTAIFVIVLAEGEDQCPLEAAEPEHQFVPLQAELVEVGFVQPLDQRFRPEAPFRYPRAHGGP